MLMARGALRIQEITLLSGIPRSSVYESLKHLQDMGIAEEEVDDNFKRYRAYPIGVLRHGIDERITSLEQQSSDLEILERAMSQMDNASAEPTAVRYYKGQSGARQILWNALKSQNIVYVYSEWGRQEYVGLKFYERFVAETKLRRLKEKVLINMSPATLADIKRRNVPGSAASRTSVEDIRVLDRSQVSIKGDTLMYNNIYAQIYLRDVAIHGFEIESDDFVRTQRSIFETLWQTAKPVAAFL